MAHPQQIEFCQSVKKIVPEFFNNKFVLDIGSLDINGNNQCLFDDCGYLGLDVSVGRNVDVTCKGHELSLPDATFDTIISTECFEHDQFYDKTLANILRLLKPGGLFIFTCATTGRPEHGTRRTTPQDAPLLQSFDDWSDYYKNLDESDVRAVLDIDAIFSRYEFSVCQENYDLYFWGIKAGSLAIRTDYSFQVVRPSAHLAIAQQKQLAVFEAEVIRLEKERLLVTDWAQSLEQALAENNELLKGGKEEVSFLKQKLEKMMQDHQDIYASRLWRYSIPIRQVASKFKFVSKLIKVIGYAIRHYHSLGTLLYKTQKIYRREGVSGLKLRANMLLIQNDQIPLGARGDDLSSVYQLNPEKAQEYQPKVSIIIPNYNHHPYLRQRLESVYSQSYHNYEVILLDDCSTDNSIEILSEYAKKYPLITKTEFNAQNSGGVFKQWKKGLELATGELVWIAESDDYCDSDFLTTLVKGLSNQAVTISFARSVFVKGEVNQQVWSTEEYLADLNYDIWRTPFIKSAHWLVNHLWSIKNIIPNVSSAVFRHPANLGLLDEYFWQSMRVCGDWVFYLHIIRGGLVAYFPQATNFYRQHINNTSVSSHSSDLYYCEHEVVAKELLKLYDISDEVIKQQFESLKKQWQICRPSEPVAKISNCYDFERIAKSSILRKPNLLMASYALAAGGGETFPIMLANLMKSHGYGVTFFNCHRESTELGVRRMLRPDIPLLELERLDQVGSVFSDLGIEIVHSHHAWVDISLATLLHKSTHIKHVVTMHGMYEMMSSEQLSDLIPVLKAKINRLVYTADKNASPFSEAFRQEKGLIRIDNALPIIPIEMEPRSRLGIAETDFVICLVSRAIPEKGWDEAIRAVQAAQRLVQRPIHLILIGEGTEFDRLKQIITDQQVHFLGFKKNIRDYFAMADIGFLPSRFKGESFPLVLMDCLLAGKPVLASDIGEISQMIKTTEGITAGLLFKLQNGSIPIDHVAELIVKLAQPNSTLLCELQGNVSKVASKFDPEVMFKRYDEVYQSVYSSS